MNDGDVIDALDMAVKQLMLAKEVEHLRDENKRLMEALSGENGWVICVHCDNDVMVDELNHWRECEKHPAREEMERLEAEVESLRIEARHARYWRQLVEDEPRLRNLPNDEALEWVGDHIDQLEKDNAGLATTLEAMENSVAQVYGHLTGGKFAKCDTEPTYVIVAVEERYGEEIERLEAEAQKWQDYGMARNEQLVECRASLESRDLALQVHKRGISDLTSEAVRLQAEVERLEVAWQEERAERIRLEERLKLAQMAVAPEGGGAQLVEEVERLRAVVERYANEDNWQVGLMCLDCGKYAGDYYGPCVWVEMEPGYAAAQVVLEIGG